MAVVSLRDLADRLSAACVSQGLSAKRRALLQRRWLDWVDRQVWRVQLDAALRGCPGKPHMSVFRGPSDGQ